MSERRKPLNITLKPEARDRLEGQSITYGALFGTRVSNARMIEQLILEKPDPSRNAPCAWEISESLQIEHAFSISYRTDDGRLLPLRILGGRIVAHGGEGKLLAFILDAPAEILPYGSLMAQNFLLPLQRLECFEPSPERFDMLKPMPYVTVSIQLSPGLAARHEKHPDDVKLEERPDGSFRLIRSIEHSALLLEQLVQWGTEAKVLGPDTIRDEVVAQLKAILDLY